MTSDDALRMTKDQQNTITSLERGLKWAYGERKPLVLSLIGDVYEDAGIDEKCKEYREAAEIASQVWQLELNRFARLEELEKAKQEIDRAFAENMAELTKRCKHIHDEYRHDASGNNDSDYKCRICGRIE